MLFGLKEYSHFNVFEIIFEFQHCKNARISSSYRIYSALQNILIQCFQLFKPNSKEGRSMVLYMRLLKQTVSGALSLTPNKREMQSMTKNILI